MTLTLSTQWQYNYYPSARESNLRINRALSFTQESRYGTGRSLQTSNTIPLLSRYPQRTIASDLMKEEPTTKQQYGDRVKHRILLKNLQKILDGIRTTSVD